MGWKIDLTQADGAGIGGHLPGFPDAGVGFAGLDNACEESLWNPYGWSLDGYKSILEKILDFDKAGVRDSTKELLQ